MSFELPPSAPRMERVEMTSALAEKLLAGNDNNRNMRMTRVRVLAEAMRRGEWRGDNGAVIVVTRQGRLLDGQHRLRAVALTDANIPMWVLWDADDEVHPTIDIGAKRTLSDELNWRGEVNNTQLGAALKFLWLHRRNPGDPTHTMPTPGELLELLDNEPGIRRSVRIGTELASRFRGPGSLFAVAHHELSVIDYEDAELFFARLYDGVGLGENDPIRRLREWFLVGNRASSRDARTYAFAVTLKAWNAFRRGASVQVLRWSPGGARPEAFPEPI